ncbi:MAG TPA: type II toxin-antitoxin system VapC family toxin [Acidobacteriaceae bacterium]|nr:type II toxin-antitoxin system VapC family toxin [Acidobacteriaceae bacterium]
MADLFDTNILIDYFKGIQKASRELKSSAAPAISTVTWIEVMAAGTTPADIAMLRAFLANFKQLPVTDSVAERAAANRRQMRIKLPDAIILATAQVANRQLVTRNVKDFPAGMAGVKVPYRV